MWLRSRRCEFRRVPLHVAALAHIIKPSCAILESIFPTQAMGKTAEEKSRARYAEQLGRGLEPRPLNDVNRAILAEVRAEVQQGKRRIQQEVEQGSAQIKSVADDGVTLIKDVTKQEKIEGKKQIRANAAKGKKSVQQAGSVAVQLIKDIAESERQKITDHAETAAREALKKALPAAETQR